MRRIAVVTALLLLPMAAVIADVVVEYVEGNVEVRDGNAWYGVYIGDSLSPSDSLRLGQGAYIELRDAGRTIKLTRPGTYDISNLVATSQRTASAGLGGLVLGRISRLAGQDEQEQQTAAGGARASQAVTGANDMQWAGTLESVIEEGIGYLNEGAYDDAYWAFEEAYEVALTSELPEAAFYLGYTSFLTGDVLEATELLEEFRPDPGSHYYVSHVLALGQLLVEGFAYQDAIDYLRPLSTAQDRAPEDRQSAQLMLGLAYQGLGMKSEARRYLELAKNTAPGTDAAAAAGRLLQDM